MRQVLFCSIIGDFNLPQLASYYNGTQQIRDSLFKLISTLISYPLDQIVFLPARENNIRFSFRSQILSHDEILDFPPFNRSDH